MLLKSVYDLIRIVFVNAEVILAEEFQETFSTISSFLIGSLDHIPASTLLPSMIALSITMRASLREEAKEKEKEKSACCDARFDKSPRPFEALPFFDLLAGLLI